MPQKSPTKPSPKLPVEIVRRRKGKTPVTPAVLTGDPNELLTAEQLSAVLAEMNLHTAPSTLSTKRCRGDGPPFVRYGIYVRYPRGKGVQWALNRVSELVSSTSEAGPRVSARKRKSGARP